jgi:RecA/RadA recombinase
MAEYDMAAIAAHIQKIFRKDKKDEGMAIKVGVGSDLPEIVAGHCIKMPTWWVEATHTEGLYFGRVAILAGDSDSGKTSAAITAMKAAIDQGIDVIYVETEGKTTTHDLVNWGVDPTKILLIQAPIAEEAWELLFTAWDACKQLNPGKKRIVIFDSLGNTISLRDADIDLVEQSSKPGGKGQINRLALSKMIAKCGEDKDETAVLFITYTYDLMGGYGKKIAGGTAINFYSSMSYMTSRVKWLEKTVSGKKVRYGAVVKWQLFKNHINKQNPGPKEILLKITNEGIALADGTDKEEGKEAA